MCVNEMREIEEMVAVVRDNTESCKTCTLYKEGLCDGNCELEEDNQKICTDLYNAGYRKQVEGEWIDQYHGKYANQLYKCSVCGETAFHDGERWFLTQYCPNCGAKMKGNEGHA